MHHIRKLYYNGCSFQFKLELNGEKFGFLTKAPYSKETCCSLPYIPMACVILPVNSFHSCLKRGGVVFLVIPHLWVTLCPSPFIVRPSTQLSWSLRTWVWSIMYSTISINSLYAIGSKVLCELKWDDWVLYSLLIAWLSSWVKAVLPLGPLIYFLIHALLLLWLIKFVSFLKYIVLSLMVFVRTWFVHLLASH